MNNNLKYIVDCNILKDNIAVLQNDLKEYKNIIISLKQNSLNHGLCLVNKFVEENIKVFTVDNLSEALKVRNYNRKVNIICCENIKLEYIFDCINNNIVIRIYDLETLYQIKDLKIKDNLQIELLLNCGYENIGLNIDEFNTALNIIQENKHFNLYSITTNIYESNIDNNNYLEQVSLFSKFIENKKLSEVLIYFGEKSFYYNKVNFCNGIELETLPYGFMINQNRGIIEKYNIQKNNLQNKLRNINIKLHTFFYIESYVIKIIKIKEKEIFLNIKFKSDCQVGILPLGRKDGISENIKHCLINNKQYDIIYVTNKYLYIVTTDKINRNDKVLLYKNELEQLKDDPRIFMQKFSNNIDYKYF